MSIRRLSLAALSVATAFALSACGTTAPGTDPGYYDDGSYTDPAGGAGGYYPSQPSTTNPYQPGYPSTVTPGYGASLTATVLKVKNGKLFGMGALTATVEVANPTTQPLTGTLTVTFTNGGKASKYTETQTVSVGAGQTQTVDLTCKNWGVDNATAEVTTDPSTLPAGGYAQATNPYGQATNPYGQATNPYGQTTTPTYGQTY